MKHNLIKTIVAVTALIAVSKADAYVYSFGNHTNDDIAIGMRYKGINEPLEQRTIKANSGAAFRPGDPDISSSKSGFIVEQFFYLPDPHLSNFLRNNGGSFKPRNILNAPWRALPLKWAKSDIYDKVIAFAENLGDAAETFGKAALKVGAASLTGGASELADQAQSIVQARGKTLQEVTGQTFNLGKLVGSVTDMAKHSMATNRHIDIFKDPLSGEYIFITRLGRGE